MKERYFRPTIAFADAGDGLLKGSGRSVPGFHIRDALSVVAAQHPTLISKYGGHAMAAGLTLPEANFPLFAEAFDAEVRRQLREEDLTGRLLSDGTLAVEEFHLNWPGRCGMPVPGASISRSRCSMACSSWSSNAWWANGT